MANTINYSDKVYKEFGVKTGENTSEFFEIGADAKNVFIQNEQRDGYGDIDGVVDLQTKLDNFNKSVRNIGSGDAAGKYATAFGQSTQANGQSSHAEGFNTEASGNHSHAEGMSTTASGNASHAEGSATQASAAGSHAEGRETLASGSTSHVEGYRTAASGNYSHAEGAYNQAIGHYSHVEGYENKAMGEYIHIEGCQNQISAIGAHVEGIGHFQDSTSVTYTFSSISSDVVSNFNTAGEWQQANLDKITVDGKEYSYHSFKPYIGDTSLFEHTLIGEPPIYYRGSGYSIYDASRNQSYILFYFIFNPAENQMYLYVSTINPINLPIYAGSMIQVHWEIKLTEKGIPNLIKYSEYSHIQGKYSMMSNCAHIVGGGTSNTDRKNIHTIDWDGNAEFAGDVTLFGCGGSNPIQLSALTKGPLIIQESMIGAYSSQGEYGDKILDAIQKNRQILILLNNQGESNYSLYSPVITYHLPQEANTELSLFYLPDGMSPTNFNIKEAQFKVSNPITFIDNLKN